MHEPTYPTWPGDYHPTPVRTQADPRFTGAGVTIALIDSGFYPHPDLILPRNRIRAWVDAGREKVQARFFAAHETPRWPGWKRASPHQWHGLMSSAIAAGNGLYSQERFRSLAPEADLILVQARDEHGHIPNSAIARGLIWLDQHASTFGLRIVNLSVAGDHLHQLEGNPVDAACAKLIQRGIVVVAAIGNSGVRSLVPPCTCPGVIAVGGLDDFNSPVNRYWKLRLSNYGRDTAGNPKPDLVAQAFGLVAPILPYSSVAIEARELFTKRAQGDLSGRERMIHQKMVTPHYQHMEGTSVAAPLVSSVTACMLQADPSLTPAQVRELLTAACRRLRNVPKSRQGAGGLCAGRAVALTMARVCGRPAEEACGPIVGAKSIRFHLFAPEARSVHVLGSWNGWNWPGQQARPIEVGVWQARLPRPKPGRYLYRFLVDGKRWLNDPGNDLVAPDGMESWDSVLVVPERRSPPAESASDR